MDQISPQLVDELISKMQVGFPDHVEGERPIHSSGVGAIGWFQGSDVASEYCKATHFGRQWTPVRVRFSNGNGQPDPDGRRQVRGMAIKFYLNATLSEELEIVPRWDGAEIVETDLVCMSVPTFLATSAEEVLDFEKSIAPRKTRRPSPWARFKSLVTMCPLPVQDAGVDYSNTDGILEFAAGHPGSHGFIIANSLLRTPSSYDRLTYHAVHAFEIENTRGERSMVRFTMESTSGNHYIGAPDDKTNTVGNEEDPAYLRDGLKDRLHRARRFTLKMAVADPWDDTADCTTPWPWSRKRVLMGSLSLVRAIPDDVTEKLAFNPGRLVDGVGLSDDPVLHARIAVYNESQQRRGADLCPVAHGET